MDYIYPIVKLHSIGEKIGGNIDFFFLRNQKSCLEESIKSHPYAV